MAVELVYSPKMASYRLAESHPLRPERFTLAVDLAEAWGLVCTIAGDTSANLPACASLVEPKLATDADLLRVHDETYVTGVKAAGANPSLWRGAFGIGPGDTPAFAHMHEASALIAGATMRGLADVVGGQASRAFCPAGGLHHAHRDHASGFCVYNDCAVGIAAATANNPGLRVAYVDIDAHHGDGVQAAFYDRADVLTISIHESGRYLFPGTGRIVETGTGEGEGFAVNLPLPPGAGDEELALAIERVVAPALRAYAPDVILAQLGADSHRADPLAHLATTVAGLTAATTHITALAEEVCAGRIVATGGGGYDSFSAVPRAWAAAFAVLLGVEVPKALPEEWRASAIAAARRADEDLELPITTFGEADGETPTWGHDPLGETEREIERLTAAHPLLRDAG